MEWRRFRYKDKYFKEWGTTTGDSSPDKRLCQDVIWWAHPPALPHQEGGHQRISQFVRYFDHMDTGQTSQSSKWCCFPQWRHCDRLTADLKASFSGCLADFDLAPSSRGPPLRVQTVSKLGPQHKEKKKKSSFTAVSLYWHNISAHKPLFFL